MTTFRLLLCQEIQFLLSNGCIYGVQIFSIGYNTMFHVPCMIPSWTSELEANSWRLRTYKLPLQINNNMFLGLTPPLDIGLVGWPVNAMKFNFLTFDVCMHSVCQVLVKPDL